MRASVRGKMAHRTASETETKLVTLATAQRQATLGQCHLLYLDESDVHLLPLIREGVDEGPTSAGADAWHQWTPCFFRRAGCCQRPVVVCRS